MLPQLSGITLFDADDAALTLTGADNPGGYGEPYQIPENLIDNRNLTLWADLNFSVVKSSTVVLYLADSATVASYALFTAKVNSNRDPVSWTFGIMLDGVKHPTSAVTDFVPPLQRGDG